MTGEGTRRFPAPRDQRKGARLVVLGLGSNVDGKEQIGRAVERLAFEFDLLVKSTRYVGPAEGESGGESEYSNAAALVRTADTFGEIRKKLRRIEGELGRDRSTPERVAIDIDVLLIQGETVRNKEREVVVPHPDLTSQRHAALPCAEVAPSLMHPVTMERIGEIAARLA